MTEFLTTPSGARIAYDRDGDGPPVLLIGGAMQFRAVDDATRTLVHELAARGLTAVNYDRPGRGDSTASAPGFLAGEVEAVTTLVTGVGGGAALYGSSSGAAIALAAAAEVPEEPTRLVLWEPPFGPEGGAQGAEAASLMRSVVRTGDPDLIIRTFMQGMPPEWFDAIRGSDDWPRYAAMAPTLAGDAEALAWAEQSPRADRWTGVQEGSVVLAGQGAFDFLAEAATAAAASLPSARLDVVAGDAHQWEPADLANAIGSAVLPG